MRAQPVNSHQRQNSERSTCLYLGPQGERCDRPALDGGFCELHEARRPFSAWGLWLRRAAAAILLLVILWVTFGDFLREILPWFR